MRRWLVAAALLGCGARTSLGVLVRDGGVDAADAGDEASVDASFDAPEEDAPSTCPALAMLAATAAEPDTLALAGAFVYFRDSAGIWRVPKAGGAAQEIAPAANDDWPSLAGFALAGPWVFFADDGHGARVPAGGGPAEPLGFTLDQPGFAASASHVYVWPRLGVTTIEQLDFSGQSLIQVDALPDPPSRMVFVGETGYAAIDPGIYALTIGSGHQILSGLIAIDLAVDGSSIYFTSADATNGARLLVLTMPSLTTTPIADTSGALSLALGATDLYFVDADAHRVRRVAGKTGPVTDVAVDGSDFSPVDLAVDDGCVYWTSASRLGATAPGRLMVAPR